MNHVKLYSNGLAVYTREYPLDGTQPTRISIPVKKSDLDEVVASIAVFGKVRMPYPPSYTPVNASTTFLQISPDHALKETATKLAGSGVEISKTNNQTIQGKLVGMHTSQESLPNGSTIERIKLVVLTEAGLTLVQESEILALKFTDPATQEEYRKALANAYQTIKPDSSFVDLTLIPESGTTSVAITYATPVAAWKPRYQFRCRKGKWELQGEAIVDNDTDDDWSDSLVSVITGEPISFETDLAEIRRPSRSRVNVVSNEAPGAVALEQPVRRLSRSFRSKSAMPPMAPAARAETFGMADSGEFDESAGLVLMDRDQVRGEQAEVRESGDFSIFTSSTPVSIASKKSAIIPLFQTPLDDSRIILMYNSSKDPRRPFRAIRFKNETGHPLGKGVCEVYLDDDFQGKAILEATSPKQDAFLVHAREMGVRVHADFSGFEHRRTGIRIQDGVVACEQASRTLTTYRIHNTRNERFDFHLEHTRRLNQSHMHVKCSHGEATIDETPSGWRISFVLPAHQSNDSPDMEIEIQENSLETQTWMIGNVGTPWLIQNIIHVKNPLAKNPGIKRVLELQKKVDALNHQIHQAETLEKSLQADQERLLKLIPSGHADQANQWRTELGTNEAELRTLNRQTLPDLRSRLLQAESSVQEALAELSASWSEPQKSA